MEGMVMTPEFWSGKRVFVTGHTGFKGSWMSLWLQRMGAEVAGYALVPPTSPSLFDAARVAEGMVSLEGDIRDLAMMQKSMLEHQTEIVIHMAAQSLVRSSYLDPIETYSTNIMGTVNVLEAVRSTPGVKVVVVITTDKCYENQEWVWSYRENEPMGGYDPYSSSKGCAELVTAAYRQSFFKDMATNPVAVASVRAGNVIGGGDWAADRLIPDIVRALTEGRPVLIRSPHAIRPWQHVLEPLSGYLLLAEKLYESGMDYAEGWNFGPSEQDAKSVQWIVEQITHLWGDGAKWTLDTEQHPHEAHYLKLDSSKAKIHMGWQARWTLSQALKRTVAWHKSFNRGDDVREVTLSQIADFQKQALT